MNEELIAAIERQDRLMRVKASLGLRPKMKVTHIGNTPTKNTFDLRSLNQNLVKKR